MRIFDEVARVDTHMSQRFFDLFRTAGFRVGIMVIEFRRALAASRTQKRWDIVSSVFGWFFGASIGQTIPWVGICVRERGGARYGEPGALLAVLDCCEAPLAFGGVGNDTVLAQVLGPGESFEVVVGLGTCGAIVVKWCLVARLHKMARLAMSCAFHASSLKGFLWKNFLAAFATLSWFKSPNSVERIQASVLGGFRSFSPTQ